MERNNNTIKSRKGKHLTYEEIKRMQRWMNDYPRAILDGLSAKMAVLALGQEPADA